MIPDNISEHRSQRIITRPFINPRGLRRCSFCRSVGHNVTRCNSERLIEFEVVCADQARNINSQDVFKIWLRENYLENQMLLKTFVIKKFRYTTRISTSRCIDIITEYIFRTYKQNFQDTRNTRSLINDNYDDSSTETDDNLENDIINFLGEFRNTIQSEREPELHEIPNIERIIMREMVLTFISSFNTNTTNTNRKINNINLINESVDNDVNTIENCRCNICWDEKEKKQFVAFGCKHEFCKECVISSLKSDQRKQPCCALCRSEVKEITTKTIEIHTELTELIVV